MTVSGAGDGPWYLYGVTSAGAAGTLQLPGEGVRKAPVTALADGHLAAVVSPTGGERIRATRADLSAHHRVVEHVAAQATVLPVQFGVLVDGPDAVTGGFLAASRDRITAELDSLEGKREYRLVATYRGDFALREAVERSPAIRRLQANARSYHDTIRLGELVSRSLESVKDEDASRIESRLRPHAAGLVALPRRGEPVAAQFAVLVGRDDHAAFDGAVDRLASDLAHRMSFELVGPLAPWDFVSPEPLRARRPHAGAV